MRHLLIGDIHGCIDELNSLLELLKPETGDQIILLGDLFDRGEYSWEVFQRVKQLAREFGPRFVLIRGNHDDYLLNEHMSPLLRRIWIHVGRQATAASFQRHGEEMESARPWLREHCVLFRKEKRFQCAHAGVRFEPIEENAFDTLVHDHGTVPENTYAGRLTITGHIGIERPAWFKGNGETECLDWHRDYLLPGYGVICIDTGCGKGGVLTGMVIEEDHFRLLYA